MPIATDSDEWANANEQSKNKSDNKTGINTDTFVNALSDLESGKAYTTVDLWRYIVHNDVDSDEQPDSDDLRSFVPIYGNITTKNGNLTAKTKKQYGLADDSDINRKKLSDKAVKSVFDVDDADNVAEYGKWAFTLV